MDEILLNITDEGQLTINLVEGQRLKINLVSNPSTGYRWEVVKPNQNILMLAEEIGPFPEPGEEGTPGKQTFIFRAVGKGQTLLILNYSRGIKGQEPASTFTSSVIVE